MKKRVFISPDRMRRLQENIGWLDNFIMDNEMELVVGESVDEIDPKLTKWLRELSYVNERKAVLLKKLVKHKKQ